MNAEQRLEETRQLHKEGFSLQEVTNLLWLRQWYQSGGSDRAVVVRHWEFLKRLVNIGTIGGKFDGYDWNR